MERKSQRLVMLAKVGAVAFALVALGYLVVNAQRDASPARAPKQEPPPAVVDSKATVPPESEPPAASPAEARPYFPSSKSLKLAAPMGGRPSEEAPPSESTFFPSSKSGRISPPVIPTTQPSEKKP